MTKTPSTLEESRHLTPCLARPLETQVPIDIKHLALVSTKCAKTRLKMDQSTSLEPASNEPLREHLKLLDLANTGYRLRFRIFRAMLCLIVKKSSNISDTVINPQASQNFLFKHALLNYLSHLT